MLNYQIQRQKMIQNQLIKRGISDKKVLAAFEKVPREKFVSLTSRHIAYSDSPLSIGQGQTISQPYIVALMMQALELEKGDIVLEIGTGSGYQTALLAEIAHKVFTIERIPELMESAQKVLSELGYQNIIYKIGDGTLGWSEFETQKFDKIIVAAAAPKVPDSYIEQLALDGKLIIPTGNKMFQQLIVVRRTKDGFIHSDEGGCAFVPLIGEKGWNE